MVFEFPETIGAKVRQEKNAKQWSAIKKAAIAAIKKYTKQEVKSLVSWQHYRKQLITEVNPLP